MLLSVRVVAHFLKIWAFLCWVKFHPTDGLADFHAFLLFWWFLPLVCSSLKFRLFFAAALKICWIIFARTDKINCNSYRIQEKYLMAWLGDWQALWINTVSLSFAGLLNYFWMMLNFNLQFSSQSWMNESFGDEDSQKKLLRVRNSKFDDIRILV